MMDGTAEGFKTLVGSSLEVEEAGFAIEVTGVDDAADHTSVLFKGPADPVLAQATYTLHHDSDVMPVFIVPVGADEDGTTYEAVFNAAPEGAEEPPTAEV